MRMSIRNKNKKRPLSFKIKFWKYTKLKRKLWYANYQRNWEKKMPRTTIHKRHTKTETAAIQIQQSPTPKLLKYNQNHQKSKIHNTPSVRQRQPQKTVVKPQAGRGRSLPYRNKELNPSKGKELGDIKHW